MDELRATAGTDLAGLAARQHGVVTAVQLRELGLTKDQIWKWTRAGRLHRVFRGVYAVGHAGLGNEGRWHAAVLACGEGAALSHRSAAELWRLLPCRAHPVDVTVPSANGRTQRSGIRLHRSPSLTRAATTVRTGIAVTTPARTLRDLARCASGAEIRRALREAEILGYPLGHVEGDRTRSELEYRFLRLCRRHRLPAPEVNVRVGPFRVDFLWRKHALIVETDGYQFHRGRVAFEADRTRQLELERLGYRVRRFTWRQVTADSAWVAAVLRRGLAGSSS